MITRVFRLVWDMWHFHFRICPPLCVAYLDVEGKEPEFGDDDSECLSVVSAVVVREAEVPSEAFRSEPACKAR